MKSIFLSASIPLPDRHPRYIGTADVVAIRDSIRALVSVVVPHGRLVFGGHPAITPLIRLLIAGMGRSVGDHVTLYQSRFFEERLPADVGEFEEVRFTAAINGNRDESLEVMRIEMIGKNEFDAGVFIGGMEGVEIEYALFRKLQDGRPVFPIASTGAAALQLYKHHHDGQSELLEDLLYLSLFRRLLKIVE
jgi:hypothetical protein